MYLKLTLTPIRTPSEPQPALALAAPRTAIENGVEPPPLTRALIEALSEYYAAHRKKWVLPDHGPMVTDALMSRESVILPGIFITLLTATEKLKESVEP